MFAKVKKEKLIAICNWLKIYSFVFMILDGFKILSF